jgi:hypothetical protein
LALSKKLETKGTLLDEHTGGRGKTVTEMPGSVASGTPCSFTAHQLLDKIKDDKMGG